MTDFNTIFQGQRAYDTQNITATGAWLSWSRAESYNSKTGEARFDKTFKSGSFPLLLSQINMTYSRSIQPIYPVNSATDGTFTKLQIMGAPQGTLQCTGIITPRAADLDEFLTKVGANCEAEDIAMDFRPFSTASDKCNNKFGYRMIGLTLQTIGFSVQGNEVAIISQPLAFTFTGLQLINITEKEKLSLGGVPRRL